MRSVKKPVKYKSLSIPEPLFNEMRGHAEKSSYYVNMADFLRQAIRNKLELDKLDSAIVEEEDKATRTRSRLSKNRGYRAPTEINSIALLLASLSKEITDLREELEEFKKEKKN